MRVKCKLFFQASLCLLLIRPCYPAEKKPFWSRFSLKLTGGGGFAAIGDMNSHLKSINKNETFEYWRKHDPTSIAGEIKALDNWGYDSEIELRIDLGPRLSIGITVAMPFRRRNESTLSFAAREERGLGGQTTEIHYRPEIKLAMPIKTSLYYLLREGTRLKVYLMGGIGYYPGKLAEYYRHTITNFGGFPELAEHWVSLDWNAKGRYPFGVHGGLGIEYPVSKSLFLVMDIQTRYVRIGNLQGSSDYRGSDGTYVEEKGSLFYFTYGDPGIKTSYKCLDVWATSEKAGARLGDFRKAVLDLSGFSLRVGVRINLS